MKTEQCSKQKWGEYNLLRCSREADHRGECCWYVAPEQAPKRTAKKPGRKSADEATA